MSAGTGGLARNRATSENTSGRMLGQLVNSLADDSDAYAGSKKKARKLRSVRSTYASHAG